MTPRPGGTHAFRAALAILAAAAALDLLGRLADVPALWIAGAHLALPGIAVGAASLVYRVVGGAAGPRRATLGLLGALGLLLYALARWVRGAPAIPPDPAVLLAEPLAVALLWLAGWIGRPARYEPLRRFPLE